MSILKLILDNTDTTKEEIKRCLKKTTIFFHEEGMLFMANDSFIFYYIVEEKSRTSKKHKAFYEKCYPFMKNKHFYSKDIKGYEDRCIEVKGFLCKQSGNKLYRWL